MPIGPHQGKLVERVIITHPDFIHWSFTRLHGGFRWLLDHMQECIDLFDEKPFSSEEKRACVCMIFPLHSRHMLAVSLTCRRRPCTPAPQKY